MLEHRKRGVFGFAKQHEMSIGAAEELEAVEQEVLYSSPQVEALMERVAEGDEEAWEKVKELQRELAAKQHRRSSI